MVENNFINFSYIILLWLLGYQLLGYSNSFFSFKGFIIGFVLLASSINIKYMDFIAYFISSHIILLL